MSSRGFTLLELLVVLALMGLVAGLAMPRLSTLYASVQERVARDEIEQALAQIYYRVHERLLPFSLSQLPDPAAEQYVAWPSDWELKAEQPIRFFPSGYCEGGTVTVRRGSAVLRYRMHPPFCRPEAF